MNHRNNIYRTYSKNPQVVQLVILGKLINEYLWICLCTAVEMEWSQMSHSRVLRVHFHCHSKYVVEMKCATQNDQINRSRLVRPNYSKSNSSWWSWYDRCCLITKRLNKEELNNKVLFSCPVHGSVAWELLGLLLWEYILHWLRLSKQFNKVLQLPITPTWKYLMFTTSPSFLTPANLPSEDGSPLFTLWSVHFSEDAKNKEELI